jgi:3-hydroxyisobutyrate dehydrogenase
MYMTSNWNVGFIGTGVMGKSMAGHIQNSGYKLFVFNRSKEKATDLLNNGAIWCETTKEMAEKVDVLFTIVGYPSDVEEIYLGKDGIISNGRKGQIFIDMTTSNPSLAKKIHRHAKKKGIDTMDAPVSGGDIGAQNATLAIMVGGEQPIFEKMLPLFGAMGKNIVYQGLAGAGQHTKMSNQIAIASNMIGVCEALYYAKSAGLDLDLVLKSISTGAAGSWSLTNLGPRILKGDYEPGFYIKHFIKDMRIAIEESDGMGITLPGLLLAKSLYDELAEDGYENKGTQALYHHWNQK